MSGNSYNSKVAASYDSDREVEEHWHLESKYVMEYFQGNQPDRILDIPVGTGRFLGFYPMNSEILGLDLSDDMLEVARSRLLQLGRFDVALETGDVLKMQYIPDDSLDCIVCFRLLHLIPDSLRPQMFSELRRVLRGEILLQVYLSRQPSFLRQILRKWLGPVWRSIRGLYTSKAPWAHISSFAIGAQRLDALCAEAGLAIREKRKLCEYHQQDVVVVRLQRAGGT